MPTKLRKLKITRVAVCEQGACYDPTTGSGAHLLLFKAAESPGLWGDAPGTKLTTEQEVPFLKAPHREPDGDEYTPLDYNTRARHDDLWGCLYDKWERFCCLFYDVIGDCDDDNIPHLPILVESIGQFQADVAQLLIDLKLTAKMAPGLDALDAVAKAGSAMAQHRKQRLMEAIATLQTILDECSPSPAAKGMAAKGVTVADTLEGVTKRAEAAEAQVAGLMKRAEQAEAGMVKLTERLALLEPLEKKVAELEETITVLKMSPEDIEARWLADLPEPVRKKMESERLEKEDLKRRLDEAEAESIEKAYMAKTAAYKAFGMTPKHWRILKHFEGLDDEHGDRTELFRLVGAAMALSQTGEVFKSAGFETHDAEGEGRSGSPSDQLMARTNAYMTEHNVSWREASDAVVKSDPGLYERSVMEKRRQNRVSSE